MFGRTVTLHRALPQYDGGRRVRRARLVRTGSVPLGWRADREPRPLAGCFGSFGCRPPLGSWYVGRTPHQGVTADAMVSIEPVDEDDLPVARRLHNRFTAQSISRETVAGWFDEVPGLFLLATDGDDPVGVATGKPRGPPVAELAGLGVRPARRREGIGSRLLERFETNAVAAGFETVSLGSAGGYVDEFYADRGYQPASILVRLEGDDAGTDVGVLGYEVLDERVEGDVRKLYLAADEVDQDRLARMRADLGDDEAIYIMRKVLGDG